MVAVGVAGPGVGAEMMGYRNTYGVATMMSKGQHDWFMMSCGLVII